jgi:hypothetical protein
MFDSSFESFQMPDKEFVANLFRQINIKTFADTGRLLI